MAENVTHVHDVTRAAVSPLCGATTGVCVDSDEATCRECLLRNRAGAEEAGR